MTPRERELLDAIGDAPDDDGPRLEWADHVGGVRGELVVIQCDLARGELSRDEHIARRRREAELLEWHWDRLWDFRYTQDQIIFRRGFVEAIVDDYFLAKQIHTILEKAPTLRSVRAVGLYGLGSLLRWQSLGQIDRLLVSKPSEQVEGENDDWYEQPRGDEALEMIVESPHLEALTGLAIEDGRVTQRGVRALVASRRISQLETAWLDDGHVATSAMVALVDSCPNLFSLSASCTAEFPDLARRLPALEEIILTRPSDRALDDLVQSKANRNLTTLRLSGGTIESGAAFADLRQLHTLELTGGTISFAELARVRLRRLRRLVIDSWISTDDAFAIAEAFGGQLHELAIEVSETTRDELAKYAPGVVKLERRARFL